MQPVNVSAINDYAYCPFRWWAKWVMNWAPKEDADALESGKILHKIFEDHARGVDMDLAISSRITEWKDKKIDPFSFEGTTGLKVITTIEDLREALVQWKDQYELDVVCLEVETPFEITIDGITYRGRPDRVAVMNGMLWHVQTKGLNAQTNFGIFTDLAKRSYHEHLYAEALAAKYPNYKYGGTLFNLVRKLKYRTKVTKKNSEGEVKELSEMFQQFPMSINLVSPLHKHVMDSMKMWVRKMMVAREEWETWGSIPAPNEKANGGYYGNSPDVYFRVLTGEIELGDTRYFKKREDTYATTGAE